MPSYPPRIVLDFSACTLLVGLSMALFWPPHVARSGLLYVGSGADLEQFIWFRIPPDIEMVLAS